MNIIKHKVESTSTGNMSAYCTGTSRSCFSHSRTSCSHTSRFIFYYDHSCAFGWITNHHFVLLEVSHSPYQRRIWRRLLVAYRSCTSHSFLTIIAVFLSHSLYQSRICRRLLVAHCASNSHSETSCFCNSPFFTIIAVLFEQKGGTPSIILYYLKCFIVHTKAKAWEVSA